MTLDIADPKGLIRESYRIEGIQIEECRSIFLDWAMAAKDPVAKQIEFLLATYAQDAPDHPMSTVLREGLATPPVPKRRGGRRGRMDS
ncbi:hypothetical protein [Actibacterium lipolyticum]|uniref:Uncharacterized protein n=1 Tax=Actibacterium lipolyticum TaxID=1524263 RepID=A0A238KHK6_9RHOB|nr:hypothetical protein [Actibacterium lipolyticum]SMX42293.1 hypothetical protein COL8621_01933 [Actibacterium lipolyticum]